MSMRDASFPVTRIYGWTSSMSFGTRIQSLRKQLGLSQAALAERLDTDQATISRWERDVNSPDERWWTQLSKVLKTSPAHLVFGDQTLQPMSGATLVSVRGAIEADVFRPSEEELSPKERVPFQVPTSLNDKDIASFKVRGDSCDLEAPDGSIVFCISSSARPPLDGDLVVVERERSGLLERTLKELRIRPNGAKELHGKSSQPRWQGKTIVPEDAANDADVVTIAWVVDQITVKRRNPNHLA